MTEKKELKDFTAEESLQALYNATRNMNVDAQTHEAFKTLAEKVLVELNKNKEE